MLSLFTTTDGALLASAGTSKMTYWPQAISTSLPAAGTWLLGQVEGLLQGSHAVGSIGLGGSSGPQSGGTIVPTGGAAVQLRVKTRRTAASKSCLSFPARAAAEVQAMGTGGVSTYPVYRIKLQRNATYFFNLSWFPC
jgi:hypothetical protein